MNNSIFRITEHSFGSSRIRTEPCFRKRFGFFTRFISIYTDLHHPRNKNQILLLFLFFSCCAKKWNFTKSKHAFIIISLFTFCSCSEYMHKINKILIHISIERTNKSETKEGKSTIQFNEEYWWRKKYKEKIISIFLQCIYLNVLERSTWYKKL